MEIHGIDGIPWNSWKTMASMEINGIQWNPWHSMEFMENHGIHGNQRNSMEIRGVHGVPWNPWKSMESLESLDMPGIRGVSPVTYVDDEGNDPSEFLCHMLMRERPP